MPRARSGGGQRLQRLQRLQKAKLLSRHGSANSSALFTMFVALAFRSGSR